MRKYAPTLAVLLLLVSAAFGQGPDSKSAGNGTNTIPAGPAMPCHNAKSRPGMVCAAGGTSGSCGIGCADVTASARTLPSLTWPIDVESEQRGAVGFRGAVDASSVLADQLELLRILQLDLGRRCESSGAFRQLAKARASVRCQRARLGSDGGAQGAGVGARLVAALAGAAGR